MTYYIENYCEVSLTSLHLRWLGLGVHGVGDVCLVLVGELEVALDAAGAGGESLVLADHGLGRGRHLRVQRAAAQQPVQLRPAATGIFFIHSNTFLLKTFSKGSLSVPNVGSDDEYMFYVDIT